MRIALALMLMRLARLLFAFSLAVSPAVLAEIETLAIPGEAGPNLYWWPRLPAVAGWHHDREFSLHYGANALAPDGFTFANAEAVIYAKAVHKPLQPPATSLATFIADDKAAFLSHSPEIKATEVASLPTGDGNRLRSFTFSPASTGNWERVTYGEEGEFYLVFTVSSHTEAGYKAAFGTYEKLILQYKAAP